ncbi:MAG: DegV family protein [Clostridia bacterium]|nr:DegV family protein [Clostridia bacterium]
MYKLAYLPVFYKVDDVSYLDGINATGRDFINIIKNNDDISSYGISSGVFQFVCEKLSERGYRSLFVVCPHGKWSDFYRSSKSATKKFYRNAINNNETDIMPVYVYDSRAFGIGPVLMANRLSRMYAEGAMRLELLCSYAERFANSSATYILTADNNVFGCSNELRAYRVSSTRVFPLDISQMGTDVKIDNFVHLLSKAIKMRYGRFAVSYGPDCDFVSDVAAQLETKYSCFPVVEAQYSIPTIKMLGSRTLCVHLGDYI